MKTKLLFVAVTCLLLFPVSARAQQGGMDMTEFILRSEWSGQRTFNTTWGILSGEDPHIRMALNISDEQYQEIQDANRIDYSSDPEMQMNSNELFQLQMLIRRDAGNANEETINRMKELEGTLFAWSNNNLTERLDNLLTPEQKQKIAEIKLVALGETFLISPHVFDPLGLTDDQKQHMEQIKKELEPEFENILEIFLNGRKILSEKWSSEYNAELERQGGMEAFSELVSFDEESGLTIRQANREKLDALVKTVQEKMKDDVEYTKIQSEINSTGRAFATQLRVKMFDVLTDEQWARFQILIDNPPEHAKAYLKEVKKWSGEAEKVGGWVPGPDSWRPGMPVPESYRQRNTQIRFPRPANQ